MGRGHRVLGSGRSARIGLQWDLLFGERADQLEGEPQTLFGITVKLASVHPPIDGAHVPDAAYLGGELAADKADELLDDLRYGEAKRFTMCSKIGTRCGNSCHWNLLQI